MSPSNTSLGANHLKVASSPFAFFVLLLYSDTSIKMRSRSVSIALKLRRGGLIFYSSQTCIEFFSIRVLLLRVSAPFLHDPCNVYKTQERNGKSVESFEVIREYGITIPVGTVLSSITNPLSFPFNADC